VSIPFAGPISPEARSDIRDLYQRRSPWARALLLLGGAWALAVACFPGTRATVIFRLPPSRQVPMPLGGKLLFIAVAALFFLAAVGLAKWWWRWWWPQIERKSDDTLIGRAGPNGVRWGSDGEVIHWSRFLAAKRNDSTVLLYLTRAYALPFHRSMFRDAKDWFAFLGLVEKSKVPLHHYDKDRH
jgi:hypothetical protein